VRWLARHRLTLATGLAAAVPLIVSAIRALADGWMPAGDQAIIAIRAYDVLSTHMPLLGKSSVLSAITHHPTYSPGPTLFWMLALPVRLGAPSTIAFVVGMTNAAAIVGVVALARRRGGRALMFLVAIALVFMARSFAPETLHDNWNPSVGLFPFTLLIFLCWSLASGEYRLLPLTVLVASFVAQSQVTYLLPTLGLLAVGLGGLALSRGWRPRQHRTPSTSERGEPPPLRRWALGALLVGAICWAPPAVDQIVHRPGNLVLIGRAFAADNPKLGATGGTRAVVRAVGAPPRWLRRPTDQYDTRLVDVDSAPSTFNAISCVLLLCALAGVLLIGVRRGRRDLAAGALIGLVLCAAFALAAASTPSAFVITTWYTLWWGSPAGMFVWVLLAWAALTLWWAVRRPSRLPAPGVASILAVLGIAALGTIFAAAAKPDGQNLEYGPLRTIAARLDRAVPSGTTVRFRRQLSAESRFADTGITFILRRRGIRVLEEGDVPELGAWYQLRNRPYAYEVDAYEGPPPSRSATVVARVTVRVRGTPHTISVSVARVPHARAQLRRSE
jgi:hypothetical protein